MGLLTFPETFCFTPLIRFIYLCIIGSITLLKNSLMPFLASHDKCLFYILLEFLIKINEKDNKKHYKCLLSTFRKIGFFDFNVPKLSNVSIEISFYKS